MKLSDYVMRFVADRGAKHVFFVPGGGAMHLNDSLGKCADLSPVCNLFEQASAIAAEAYARITNKLGVCMVTAGPGGTNAITGLAGAWLDSTPVVFFSGQVKRADLKRDSGVRILGAQEIDIVKIVGSITKYAVTITEPESIRYHMEKALHLATTGRRGPVWIDVPLDVQAANVEPATMRGFDPAELAIPATPDIRPLIGQLVDLLNTAERPVLLLGNGVRMAGAEVAMRALLDQLKIPVLTSWLGMDLLPASHPNYIGRPGSLAPRAANFTLQNSDLLIIVGCRLDMAMTAYAHDRLARGARKVMVDIDPAEIGKMKTPIHLPIVADAKHFTESLIAALPKVTRREWPAWMARCLDWKKRYPMILPEHLRTDGPLSMYNFSQTLSDLAGESDVFAPGSSGFACEIFLLLYEAKPGQRMFHNRGTGAMGFGLPAAIGACFASGRRQTICVDGDGGIQMNIQELATVREHQLPIKFFIINNNGYASIRASQRGYFKRLVGADPTSGMSLPDIKRVAEAYGLPSAQIASPVNLAAQIKAVLDRPGPVVCEVIVAPDEERVPRASSMQRPDGTMISKPLEDLFPFLDREEFRGNMLIPLIEE